MNFSPSEFSQDRTCGLADGAPQAGGTSERVIRILFREECRAYQRQGKIRH